MMSFQRQKSKPDSPRTRFTKNAKMREKASMKLMTALDAPRVERVKREFEIRNNSVSLVAFLNIMESNLPSQLYQDQEGGKQEIITNLVDMFREVDINGDGSMEWEEFTRFMVEKAALYKESQSIDRIPNYYHNTQMESGGHRHRGSIDCLTVLPRYKQFACTENASPLISLYGARTGNLVASMKCKAVPLSICYVEPLQSIIASCSDTTMVRFNVGDSHSKVRYKQRSAWSTPDTQMTMCWQPTHNLLYSGSVGGRVHAWDVETQEQKCCLEGHTDIVMQVLSIDCLDSIVSGSLDRTINIWDSYTEQQTTKLLGHTKGVNSLAFNSTHRFLISSGFDHDCFVWSPFSSTLLHKLRGHHAALVGCHTVEGTSELLTADTSGIFKLWDLRNFQCLQTFTTDHEPGDLDDLSGTLSCFSHAKFHNPISSLGVSGEKIDDYRIIAASKKMLFFDQERVRQDPVTDGPIRVACFNTQSLTIFTASERNVKIWDAVLGSLRQSYNNITNSDITAACLDDRQRKFILGLSNGCVTVYNYQNGAIMKHFNPQGETAVVKLIYSMHSKSVIVGYMDGLIRVYDENDIESCKVVRSFDEAYIHRGDLSTIAYLSPASLVASGGNLSSDGIRLWDFDSGKCETVIRTNGYEILSMVFLENYPILVASTSDSMIKIFGVPPFVPGGILLAEFANELPDGTLLSATNEAVLPNFNIHESLEEAQVNWDAAEVTRNEWANEYLKLSEKGDFIENERKFTKAKKSKSPVSGMAWDINNECLYTGDEGGHLRKWDLRRMLKHIGLSKLKLSDANAMRSLRAKGGRGIQILNTVKFDSESARNETSSLVEFRWGKELAHEADITTVVVTREPPAVLTTSTDCCVKMFQFGGTKIGRLVQSVKSGHQSSCWDLPIDVIAREKSERENIEEIMAEAAKCEQDNASLSRRQRKTETRGRKKRNKGKGDGKGLIMDSTVREKMHKRVLGVLANVRTHAMQAEEDDGSVSSSADTVGNMKFRDKTRRLPPSLKLNDPTARPPIVLSGLGPGLDQIQRSRSLSPDHLPQISVAHANVQVDKKGDVGDDILASMAKLNEQLDILGDG